MIVGNDIASFQGDINFDLYKSNSNFLIVKATEGVGFIDPKFKRNQSEARRVGIPLGYYHFARPELGNTPQAEAAFFLSKVMDLQEGEVLTLDYEPNWPGGDAVTWCKKFLDSVYALTNVRPLIYLNKSQVKGFNWQPVVDGGYGLWLACYDANLVTGQWKDLAMQQWTSSQIVPGINGKVDGDYFFGTAEQFKKYGWHKPVVSSPSPSLSPSPSPSLSPSLSSSPSFSLSASPSASASSSPSPSAPIPPEDPTIEKLRNLALIINSKWTWIGTNGWTGRLKLLRKILNA